MLLPLPEALAILRAQPERLENEFVLSGDAANRVSATAVINPQPIPPHTSAAIDGFALRARDVAQASTESPLLLPVGGSTRCGEAPACGMPHTVWEVFAGSALPSPFDAVISLADARTINPECRDTDAGDDSDHDNVAPCANPQAQSTPPWIRLTAPVAAGSGIRHCGEDIAAGSTLVEASTALRPLHLMALATVGIERVQVRVQPRVAVLSTGRELIDDSRDEIAPGQIRNSNAPYLIAMLQRHGALPRYLRTVLDDRDEFQRSLAWASTHRFPLVISSGATAAGREDFVGEVLQSLGAQMLFRGVAIKPGWPVLCARLPHGGFFLGLPGNPASCAACFRVFALPLLRVLNGLPAEEPGTARLTQELHRDTQKTLLLKARIANAAGCLHATALPGQEPHRIAPLLAANGWIILPPGDEPARAGDIVQTLPLRDDWAC